jgi:glycosyltransferase involved in cell wall biosynthesis
MKIFIISYYFPPIGFSGSRRAYYMAKYFSSKNYDVTVFTVKNIKYSAFDRSYDLDSNIKIVKIPTLDPQRFVKGKGKRQMEKLRIINSLIFPLDNKILWLPYLKKVVGNYARKMKPDLIVSSSPPPSIHIAISDISRKYNIPWIADLRDSISDNQLKTQSILSDYAENRLEKKIIYNATIVSTVTRNIMNRLEEKYPLNREKIILVRNGYDKVDFQYPINNLFKYKRITYMSRISHLTDIKAFLKAFRGLEEFEFYYAGVDETGELDGLIKKFKIEHRISQLGYLEHSRAMELINASDILLITLAERSGIGDVSTAKIYEYFGAKKPILLIAPHGTEAEYLIKKEHAGICMRNSDTTGIKKAIFELLNNPKKYICKHPEKYQWERNFKILEEKIELLLERERGETSHE